MSSNHLVFTLLSVRQGSHRLLGAPHSVLGGRALPGFLSLRQSRNQFRQSDAHRNYVQSGSNQANCGEDIAIYGFLVHFTLCALGGSSVQNPLRHVRRYSVAEHELCVSQLMRMPVDTQKPGSELFRFLKQTTWPIR
jgi:hypothetical protein